MPVGTQGSVKALSPDELRDLGVGILLGNTYHLALRPGAERIARLGGLHRFIGWESSILTDSGGFQVFSLDHLVTVADEGATFRSHLDGSPQRFTPESVMAVQRALGSDVAMAFDQPAPWPGDLSGARAAMERTHHWAERCLAQEAAPGQLRFGIAQGGFDADLREESTRALSAMAFDGFAVGGLSLGEPRATTYRLLQLQTAILPADRPRYLMGVGTPIDLIEAVSRGVDLCDCVLPTRIARNGSVLVRGGRINLRNARFADDGGPLDAGGDYTTRIGDPSGRSAERPMLDPAEIDRMARNFFENAKRIVDPERTEVRFNSEWLGKLDFAELLRLTRTLRDAIGGGRFLEVAAALRAEWESAPLP